MLGWMSGLGKDRLRDEGEERRNVRGELRGGEGVHVGEGI